MSNIVLPTKAEVENAYKEVHPREYPSDWALTDDEYQRVLEAAVRYGKPLGVDGASSCWSGLEVVVDEFKIDDYTFRILTEGYVLFNGAAHFASEDDTDVTAQTGLRCLSFLRLRRLSIATGLNGVCLLLTKHYPATKRYQRVDNRTRHTKLKRLIMMQQQISSENLMDIIASKKIMQQKGLMYNSAVDAGLKPMAYSFLGLPLKKIQVRLDFKVWNKVGALSLYFTELTKNKAYSIQGG